jgi:hypothetical protein
VCCQAFQLLSTITCGFEEPQRFLSRAHWRGLREDVIQFWRADLSDDTLFLDSDIRGLPIGSAIQRDTSRVAAKCLAKGMERRAFFNISLHKWPPLLSPN